MGQQVEQPKAEQAARAAVLEARELGLPRETALMISGGREHLVAELYDGAPVLEEAAEPAAGVAQQVRAPSALKTETAGSSPAAGNGDSTRPGAASSNTEILPAGLNALGQTFWYADRLRAHGYEISPARDGHEMLELHPPGGGEPIWAHPDDFPLILRGEKPPRRDRRTGVIVDPPPRKPDAAPGVRSGTGRAFNLTDLGNAERLVDEHGPDLRYVPQIGWHTWDNRRWRVDTDGEVHRRSKLVARQIARDAFEQLDGDARKRQLAWAFKSEGRPRLEAMVAVAQTDAQVVVGVDDLDRDRYQLNVGNGTLDLAGGELRNHDRADHVTKLANADYDPAADAPTWRKFLETTFAGDHDVIAFVQRAVGYSLTGSTAEQVIFLLHGRGANGKSTFVETIRALLGDYAQQAPTDLLMQSRTNRGGATPDLARLPGARFVAASETGEGRRLDEPLVKQLTGGDRIAARRLHKDFFEFTPTHKLWLATNHLPQIAGTDDAIWRRIRLIPFAVTIPEDERDPRLLAKLRAELPGILTWAVDGCASYLVNGLAQPAAVSAATQAYRDDMDELGAFLEECATLERDDAAVKASVLFTRYGYWAQAAGASPITATAFGRALTERGFRKTKRNDGIYYLGIDLAGGQAELN